MAFRAGELLAFFRSHPDQSRDLRELMRELSAASADRHRLATVLEKLVASGELVRDGKGKYRLAASGGSAIGRLALHRDGYGFVAADDGGEDIFVPARYLGECMNGDRVEVTIVRRGRFGKREGRVVRIIERGERTVVGTLRTSGRATILIPSDERTPPLRIEDDRRSSGRVGQLVVAEIVRYPTENVPAAGRVVEALGTPGDPFVEILAVIRKHGLPDRFSPGAIAEALAVPQEVPSEAVGGRTDLRDLPFVTIDGETARDFDDAVAVRRERGGKAIRLWVSIADVAHYVRPGSQLDLEAYMRGTSVYFPDRCIPMLPEELSNGICSLNPEVERLTVTAEMLFGRDGLPVERRFYPSIIRSRARLTYTVVSRILTDRDPEQIARFHPLLDDLGTMEELCGWLTARRRARGSIDFDLPEPEIVLDIQGNTEAIVRSQRTLAHRIIEEFMLSANEAVASYLAGREVPALYRVHEPPDLEKLRSFQEFVHHLGLELPLAGERIEPATLQKLLDTAAGRVEERMINQVLLRSMKQARYSAENLGHFGLASSCYTHFTSPIRRYPDLVVHRVLKGALSGALGHRDLEKLAGTLPETAAHTSARERVAVEAEREVIDMKRAEFMEDRVGEEFDGIIAGVTSFGLFVELVELFIEGLVHISTLPQDRYTFDEKSYALFGSGTGLRFRLGDRLRVRVAGASRERRQIDFVIAGALPSGGTISHAPAEEYPRVPVRGKRPRPKGEALSSRSGKRGRGGEKRGGGGRRGR